jgi:RNA polymerase sigma-70 factor (ECF subfamily)
VRRGFTRSAFGNCDVEDVVQETLLAIHLKRQTWNEGEAITPWVTAIARHKLIDNLRRCGRHIELPIDDLMDVLPAETQHKACRAETLSGFSRSSAADSSIEGLSAREDRFRISEGAVRVPYIAVCRRWLLATGI